MAKLEVACASGALILSAVLSGCTSVPRQQTLTDPAAPAATQRVAKKDRTPSWQKYYVSGSRIARPLDSTGKPMTADYVQSTTSDGLEMLPSVTRIPCTKTGHGC